MLRAQVRSASSVEKTPPAPSPALGKEIADPEHHEDDGPGTG